ncbi:MAG: hypothetical protein H7Y22_15355 [Gemmatimonadaceae bacterium]|nr:hypothetical protein [Gloeobacterales cyanobacterium ES-bin-141]
MTATTVQADSLRPVRGIQFKQIQYVRSERVPDVVLEIAILKSFRGYTTGAGDALNRYYYSKVDLNDDSRPDALVYLVGPFFCSPSGCPLLIFQSAGQDYKLIGNLPNTRQPIVVTEQKTNGWRDLIKPTAGGKDLDYAFVRFGQDRYSLGSKVLANSLITGKAVANNIAPENGIVLKPF